MAPDITVDDEHHLLVATISHLTLFGLFAEDMKTDVSLPVILKWQ